MALCTRGLFIKYKCNRPLNVAVELSGGFSLYADELSHTGEKKQTNMLCQPAALTRWTRSREKMWILQVTVDRVQMMVERMLRPHALKRRSCGGKIHPGRDYKPDQSNGANESQFKDDVTAFQVQCQNRNLQYILLCKIHFAIFLSNSNINHICQ